MAQLLAYDHGPLLTRIFCLFCTDLRGGDRGEQPSKLARAGLERSASAWRQATLVPTQATVYRQRVRDEPKTESRTGCHRSNTLNVRKGNDYCNTNVRGN